MKKKVLYIQPLHHSGMDRLREKYDVIVAEEDNKDYLKSIIGGVHAIVTRLTEIDGDMIDQAKNLKAIAKHGVGVDNIDVKKATERGIYVLTTGTANSISVAEHAFFAIGALSKNLNYLDKQMRIGNWKARDEVSSIDLTGKILGIVGFGRIGRSIAKMAKGGFQMTIMVYDPYVDRDEVEARGYVYCDCIDELCGIVDVLTIHAPLNKMTKYLIDEKRLDMMKSSAYIINFARGGIVDEKALYRALANKRIKGAALDTFEQEAPDFNNALFELDNVILSPHCGTFSLDSRIRMSLQIAEGIDDVLSDREPKFATNK